MMGETTESHTHMHAVRRRGLEDGWRVIFACVVCSFRQLPVKQRERDDVVVMMSARVLLPDASSSSCP